MSGRGAFAGMIGAAVIPIIASIFGGTRIQASGPTAPMTAISAVIVAFAYDSFPDRTVAEQFITLIFLLNGVCLVLAGLLRLGKLIQLVPNVVILGFMNGIAVLIWIDQIKKMFAIGENANPMLGGPLLNLAIALTTFGLIFFIIWTVKRLNIRPQFRSFISGVLWSIVIMTVFSLSLGVKIEAVKLGASLNSFGDFFAIITSYFPTAKMLSADYLWLALPYALQLTLLAYLDSLLTALVVDRMTREKSKLNKELIAQGLANSVSGLVQGIPGAQATIRSVLLIKEGAQSRLAGVLIGVFALMSIILFKDYLTLVPAAVFIGVLFKAGLDVCDKDFIINYLQYDWIKSRARNIQLIFIAYTTVITVVIDLNVAVISGTIFYYVAKYFWDVKDAEADMTEVSQREGKLVTN
jgi:SulP family sulfate permease